MSVRGRCRVVGAACRAALAVALAVAVCAAPAAADGLSRGGRRHVAVSTAEARARPAITENGTAAVPAWGGVLDRLPESGRFTGGLGLDYFTAVYGPVPGHRTPGGPRTGKAPDASALAAVMGQWRHLTAAQRRVAGERLGLPGRRAPGTRHARPASVYGGSKLGADAKDVTDTWLSYVRGYVRLFRTKLGGLPARPLPIKVYEDDLPGAVYMDAMPTTKKGAYAPRAPAACRIRVSQFTPPTDPDMAHEVFHCIQFALSGHWHDDLPWVIEGLAEWAETFVKADPETFHQYQQRSRRPLILEDYPAVGFWSAVEQYRGEAFLWRRIRQILDASSPKQVFQIAGADQDGFLNVWPSWSFALAPAGDAWQQKLPMLASAAFRGEVTSVPGDARLDFGRFARPYFDVRPSKDLVHVTVGAGFARGAAESRDFGPIRDQWFCRGHVCDCPDGSAPLLASPPLPLDGEPLHLAATGGLTSGSATVTNLTLEEWRKQYCPPIVAPQTISGHVSGTGSAGDFPNGGITYDGAVTYTYSVGDAGTFSYALTKADIHWTWNSDHVNGVETCRITGDDAVHFDPTPGNALGDMARFTLWKDDDGVSWHYNGNISFSSGDVLGNRTVANEHCPGDPPDIPPSDSAFDATIPGNFGFWGYPYGGTINAGWDDHITRTPYTLSGSADNTLPGEAGGLTAHHVWDLAGSGRAVLRGG